MGRVRVILLTALLSLTAGHWLRGQGAMHRQVPELSFARLESNAISFPSDSAALEPFFLKLDTLLAGGGRDLNVIHIGGSHVQAGYITSRLRSNLAGLGYGLQGSPGLVFPFAAAKTNNPQTYRSRFGGKWTSAKCTQRTPATVLGMTGMTVTTSDSLAYLRLLSRDRMTCPDSSYPNDIYFDRVRLFGYGSDSAAVPVIRIDSLTVEGFADSLRGMWTFMLPYYTDSVDVVFRGLDGRRQFTVGGLMLDSTLPGLTVHAIGVNGASLVSYARCGNMSSELSLLDADLVIFGIGINDASGSNFDPELFKARYDDLIASFRRSNPDCALLFITNNDSYRRVRKSYVNNPNGAVACKAFHEIARKWDAGVWDLFDIMGGPKSMAAWEKAGLAKKDKVHFTAEGYGLLGDLLFNALMDQYQEHLRRCSSL